MAMKRLYISTAFMFFLDRDIQRGLCRNEIFQPIIKIIVVNKSIGMILFTDHMLLHKALSESCRTHSTHMVPIFMDNIQCPIRRSSIDDDILDIRIVLCYYTPDRLLEMRFPVEDDSNDADF